MKKYIIVWLLLLFCHFSIAQAQSIQIKGRLMDSTNQPILYANVALQKTDSTLVKGTTSDDKGQFVLPDVQSNNSYLLIASYVGYVTHVVRLDNIYRSVDIGDIRLDEDAILLEGVTISASNVTKKIDRQIIMPTAMQLKSASSGYDLLNKLMLPGLKVNTIQRSISTISGGSVQLRINDIEASSALVQALRPADVIRVEYIDNPGVRYADSGVEAVINYIVKRQESGVSGGVRMMNAVTTGFGNDNIYLKANHKRSEFGLNYSLSYRDYKDRYTDEEQTFALPNGERRIRRLIGLSVPFNYADHQIEASYNLTESDKYVFNAVFRDAIFNAPHQDFSQLIKEKGKMDIMSYIRSKDKYNSPSIDLYYQRIFPRKQKLSVNVVGTYIATDYQRNYEERDSGSEALLSEYGYATDGKKYSVIGEAIYSKEFDRVNLSAGLRGMQAYTKNIYSGTTDDTADMNNSNYYGYVQLQGKWAKLNYMLGAGLSRLSFDGSGENFTYYTFRPSVMLSYPVFKSALIRYNFSVSPYIPSLSSLSDIRQQNTDIEISRGNKHLKPYRGYNNQLVFQWGNERISTQLNGSYTYRKNPIMGDVRYVSTDRGYFFEYGVANQKSFSQLGGQAYIQYKFIADVLSVSGYGGVNKYDSRGKAYSHTYTSWYGGANVSFSYKNFSLNGGLSSRYNSLYAESIEYGENNSSIECAYKLKSLRLGVGMLYPFTPKGWSAGTKQLSELVQKESWTYIKDNGNMLVFTLSWDFNYGRKHEAGRKTMNNSDGDSGIVK